MKKKRLIKKALFVNNLNNNIMNNLDRISLVIFFSIVLTIVTLLTT